MKQQDWTLLKACRFAAKSSELDVNYIRHISYGRTNDVSKYATLSAKFYASELAVHQCHSDFIFQLIKEIQVQYLKWPVK